MATVRGLERLIFFTDAIAAIAITLLILPLVDAVGDVEDGTTLGAFLADEWFRVVAFFISFVVIARLWRSHHSIFEHVRTYDGPLVQLSLLWALTIVVLPLPTAMTAAFDPGAGVVAFYIGTMALSNITLTVIILRIRRTPRLEYPENPLTGDSVLGSASASVGFIVALILGVTIPGLNYWALLVMMLLIPLGILTRRRAAARARTPAQPVTS